jgi:hypothetical protein
MKTAASAICAVLLTACASRGEVGPVPEIFSYAYEYSGQLGGTSVAGRLSFDLDDNGDLRYTIFTENGGPAPCRDYLRTPTQSRIRLSCHGLVLEFTRAGQVPSQSNATLHTTRPVERRECAQWETDRRTRQRVCALWQTVSTDQPVTHHGTIEIRRVGGNDVGEALPRTSP